MRTIFYIICVVCLFIVSIFAFLYFSPKDQSYAVGHKRLQDGDLIRIASSPDVYIVKIKNNKYFKRLILNPEIFNAYGHLSWEKIQDVSSDVLDVFTDSQLVLEVDEKGWPITGKVFMLIAVPNSDTGIKKHINLTLAEFIAAGFDWDSIYFINNTEASDKFYPKGEDVDNKVIAKRYGEKPKIVATCIDECFGAGSQQCTSRGYIVCGNYDGDSCLEWSATSLCAANASCEKGECVVKYCQDGTLYDQCSNIKPQYCLAGELIDSASLCGCPLGYEAIGEKCVVKVATKKKEEDVKKSPEPAPEVVVSKYCSDGTAYGQCSINKPKYCSRDGEISNFPGRCGCPAGTEVIDGSVCGNVLKMPLVNVEQVSPDAKALLDKLNWSEADALDVAKRVRASTVCITSSMRSKSCGGTAFVVEGGLIASAAHAAHSHDESGKEVTTFRVKTITGEFFTTERIGTSKDDIGIAKVTSNFQAVPPALPLGYAKVGEPVLAIGNTFTVGTWIPVIGEVFEVDARDPGKHDARLLARSGFSGAPVVNKRGEVIGLVGSTIVPKNLPDPAPLAISLYLEYPQDVRATIRTGTELRGLIVDFKQYGVSTPNYADYKFSEPALQLTKKSSAKNSSERLMELAWNEQDALSIARKLRASTICLAPPSDLSHCTTGWLAGRDTIITCAHCPHDHGGKDTFVARSVDNKIFSTMLLEASREDDIAIFRVTSNVAELPPALILAQKIPQPGDPVLMNGHPHSVANWATSLGEVRFVGPEGDTGIKISWEGGSSGSAIVNKNGEVIGLLTGGSHGDYFPDPYPLRIIRSLEENRNDHATVTSLKYIRELIERYK